MYLKTVFISLALLAAVSSSTSLSCPCEVDNYLLLKCEKGTITNFPEDILDNCDLDTVDPEQIKAIELAEQPMKTIKTGAFRSFPNLVQLAFIYSDINHIEQEAFDGLTKVTSLYLKGNKLTTFEGSGLLQGLDSLKTLDLSDNDIAEIEEGLLDNMPNLDNLNLAGNPGLSGYTTNAWYFCHKLETGNLNLEGDVTIIQDFQEQEDFLSEEYCQHWIEQENPLPLCEVKENGTLLDCSNLGRGESIASVGCHLYSTDLDKIAFNFPLDEVPIPEEDFGPGESAAFFSEFNGGNKDFSQEQRSLRLFGSKLDLSTVATMTGPNTREVIIRADTVYTSGPVTMDSYKVTIVARKVSISQPLTMIQSKEDFLSEDASKAQFGHTVRMTDGLVMRHRKFGLLDILDQEPQPEARQMESGSCVPTVVNVTDFDTSSWFDPTTVNLNYVLAWTLYGSNRADLATSIAKFYLSYLGDKSVVQDKQVFVQGQKFKRILELTKLKQAHNVPTYSLSTIEDLSNVMYDKLTRYRTNEIAQENQLFVAQGRITDMSTQFKIVDQQQEMYFDMEKTILNEIFAATDNAWHWSFEHRNASDQAIGNALDQIGESMFEMQEQELTLMLEEAEASVEHLKNVINKYEGQADRWTQMALASIKVQKELFSTLTTNKETMITRFEEFKEAAEVWEAKQIVKGVWGIFTCIVSILRLDPNALKQGEELIELAGFVIEIIQLLEEIYEVFETMSDMMDLVSDFDIEDINNISSDPSQEFSDALQNAVDMKLKGVTFDQIESIGRIKIGIMNEETEFGISGTDDLMMSMQAVSDVGQRLIDEVTHFADVMLGVSERLDEIEAAKADLELALKQVENIEAMLTELAEKKKEYQDNMEQNRKDYENAIEEMKEQYENMTAELRAEFEANITAKFDEYKLNFANLKEAYLMSMENLVANIQNKVYGLKIGSMTLRSMLLSLYIDYCDGTFYHGFKDCDADTIPLMADSFDALLSKLSDLQWDVITSVDNLPGIPVNVNTFEVYEDKPEELIFPVSQLIDNKEIAINLNEGHDFSAYWRFRIDSIRPILLDAEGHPVPTYGAGFANTVNFIITYPSVFNDTNFNHESFSFLAQHFFCPANYYTDESGEAIFTTSCTVNEEFTDRNFKPAIDGWFNFKLKTPDALDLSKVAKIRIEFSGSFIAFEKNNIFLQ